MPAQLLRGILGYNCVVAMSSLSSVDLFCGAGGLTHGLVAEGVPVAAGMDVDPECAYGYESNGARFILQDVRETSPEDLASLLGDADVRVLAGCAPCQPFSTYAHRYETVGTSRWALLNEFSRLVEGVRPEIVAMENVPLVAKHDVYKIFVRSLLKLGYWIWQGVVDCSAYGLPQRRRRTVLLASLLGEIELVPPKHGAHRMTVREAIGDLPMISAGEVCESDTLHAAAGLSTLNLERIRASKPGGTWRDWPEHLIADCHRRETGRSYSSVYGRMSWHELAPTITTQFFGFGNGRFGHPEQDRAISLREGAVLQGFPEGYPFVPEEGVVYFKTVGRMIGNAVPPILGRIIGRSILEHLETRVLVMRGVGAQKGEKKETLPQVLGSQPSPPDVSRSLATVRQ